MNSLKSIFSRMTSVPDAVEGLNSIGISVKNSAGEMRSVDEILADLSGKWNGLSKAQQQNLGKNCPLYWRQYKKTPLIQGNP